MEVQVYAVRLVDGKDVLQFYQKGFVVAAGGIKGLESDIAKRCIWFSPIGRMAARRHTHGQIKVQRDELNKLVGEWEKKGAPRVRGNGTSKKSRTANNRAVGDRK